MRFIREIPPAQRMPRDAALAELTTAQLVNLAEGGRACIVAIGSAGAWRPCCRIITDPWDVMCSGHLAMYRAQVEEAEWARIVLERAAQDAARSARATRKKAAHRRPRPVAKLEYNPQPHPAAEWRIPLCQVGEPHADLCEMGRGHIAIDRVRHVLDGPPPSEWPLTPGLASLRELGRRRMLA